MAFLMGLPSAVATPRFPTPAAGRYARTNPLRREGGLRLLSECLPEPLRWVVIRAWRQAPATSSPYPALPNLHQQRPDDDTLRRASPQIIGYLALIELELSRRVIEAPQASISPVTRNTLLNEESEYLRRLYNALAWHLGEASALAEFERLITSVG